MTEIGALLLTFATGLFILLGALIVFITKNNDKFVNLSISIAFGVMLTLIIIELIPEALELMEENFTPGKSILMIAIFGIIGMIILKILDIFIPDHEVHDKSSKSKKENLLHISIVSSIALVLHNIIEGMAIYNSLLSSMQLGYLVCIGVGIHNIPMGMVIASTFYKSNNNSTKTWLIISLVSISTLFGGIIMYFISSSISSLIEAILLSITFGMLIYIIIWELLPQIINSKYKKTTIMGILFGIGILLISLFLE